MDSILNRRTILAGGASLGAVSFLNLPARADTPTLPSYYPADYNKIIEASKAENHILIYSSMSPDAWDGIQKRFTALYPWIKVEILSLDSVVLMERYLAERGTGTPTCDFISAVAIEKWFQFMKDGQVLAYESPEKKFYPDWSVPIPGLYTIAIDPLIIIYNKLLLPPDKYPKSIADLAALVESDPAGWNGKIGIFGADGATSGYVGHKAFIDKYGEKGWDLFAKLGPATRSEMSAGPAVEKVLSGEYLAGYFLSPGPPWLAIADPAKAAVVGWSLINDGEPLILRPAAGLVGGKNPNSAKLWLDVTLSFEGEKSLVPGGRTPLRSDVKSSDVNGLFTYSSLVEQMDPKFLLPPSWDPAFYADHDAFVERWRKVFARK